MLINSSSLAGTIDAVNDANFWGRTIPTTTRRAATRWILSRFGLPHAYAGTFALFDRERQEGYKLFTGERVQSAAARHIAGEEACRALLMLKPNNKQTKHALG